MTPDATAAIVHAVVLVAVLVAYTVVTALGHDGNAVLLAGGSWAGGAGVAALTSRLGKVA